MRHCVLAILISVVAVGAQTPAGHVLVQPDAIKWSPPGAGLSATTMVK